MLHQACDDLDNVNEQVFEEMLYAIAHEIYRCALSTADVDNAQARAAKLQARARTSAPSHPRSGHDWIR